MISGGISRGKMAMQMRSVRNARSCSATTEPLKSVLKMTGIRRWRAAHSSGESRRTPAMRQQGCAQPAVPRLPLHDGDHEPVCGQFLQGEQAETGAGGEQRDPHWRSAYLIA